MRVEIKGMDRLELFIKGKVEEELDDIAEYIQSDAVTTLNSSREGNWKTTDTGYLAKSIEITSAKFFRRVEVTAPYGEDIEYGTDPHYVPPSILYTWARRKLRLSDKDAIGASYAISNKIKKTGTEPQPFWNAAVFKAIAWFKKKRAKW